MGPKTEHFGKSLDRFLDQQAEVEREMLAAINRLNARVIVLEQAAKTRRRHGRIDVIEGTHGSESGNPT